MGNRIKLDLSKHCIETEIRRIYNHALSAYFKENADKKHIENIIEITLFALEHFDFPRLRNLYPSLVGKTNDPVYLMVDKSTFKISIGDIIYHPICHKSVKITK